MQLGRYQISTLRPPPILSIDFSLDGKFFVVALETGYEVWRSFPLGLVRRRTLQGSLSRAVILPDAPLMALQGGGRSPLYAPNKVIIWNDATGQAIADLEFGEQVRGIAARKSVICVALSRRIIAFQLATTSDQSSNRKGKGRAVDETAAFKIYKIGEWETTLNEQGLMALSTSQSSSLLAIPGRQPGHVQLIKLPLPSTSSLRDPKHGPAFRSPIILAHTHSLSSLSVTASGSHLMTTSERGTLLRIWDVAGGRLERELRRGVDRAEMWGTEFEEKVFQRTSPMQGEDEGKSAEGEDEKRRDELRARGGRVMGWSDKGTVHVWGYAEGDSISSQSSSSKQSSLTDVLSRNLPLPKYFSSSPSIYQYHLPRKNPHAFASKISSAAEAARMPSLKMREMGEEDGDWSEKFVVGWIEVDVEVDRTAVQIQTAASSKEVNKRGGESLRRQISIDHIDKQYISMGMGGREERRSFGSEETSRTATPTMGNASILRKSGPKKTISSLSRGSENHRRSSSASPDHTQKIRERNNGVREKDGKGEKVIKKERQLIAITFGGDWYRLKLPDNSIKQEEEEGEKGSGSKCELVEYRRLNVGGGGW